MRRHWEGQRSFSAARSYDLRTRYSRCGSLGLRPAAGGLEDREMTGLWVRLKSWWQTWAVPTDGARLGRLTDETCDLLDDLPGAFSSNR
jgi:hypothetical protein